MAILNACYSGAVAQHFPKYKWDGPDSCSGECRCDEEDFRCCKKGLQPSRWESPIFSEVMHAGQPENENGLLLITSSAVCSKSYLFLGQKSPVFDAYIASAGQLDHLWHELQRVAEDDKRNNRFTVGACRFLIDSEPERARRRKSSSFPIKEESKRAKTAAKYEPEESKNNKFRYF